MASAAEQLASNINFGAFGKATELKQRIIFTLLALVVYRLGTYIPVPGIDPVVLEEFFQQQSRGVLGMVDIFSGGALSRMTIFALSIMPYISSSIIVQLMTAVVPQLEAMKKEGEAGRGKLNQYTRYLTVFLALIQSYALATGLEHMMGPSGPAVIEPGLLFRLTTTVTLTAGTMFLMWLGEQITSRGIGNGTSLIIFSSIVAGIPFSIANALELGRTGALSAGTIILLIAMIFAVIFFVVFMERAQRRVLVQYPKRQVGNKVYGGEASHLPLKLNSSGVIPAIFSSSLLLLPLTAIGFLGADASSPWAQWISQHLGHGSPLFMFLYAALIIFFSFFYTAVVFNPKDTADNLKKYGGFIPGIRPGNNTADYLDHILTRLTVLGAIYMAIVCLLPEFLTAEFSIPFYFGGTSLLIVVSVTMDTVARIQSQLLAHQYEGLIKKANLKGKRDR
ncbi:MAG: preprotein translocase subunit SecY [Alphaproteobacteria bacterium]|nr:preprotein translocase subunit SecY [Alphaproteobacteria bacterium]